MKLFYIGFLLFFSISCTLKPKEILAENSSLLWKLEDIELKSTVFPCVTFAPQTIEVSENRIFLNAKTNIVTSTAECGCTSKVLYYWFIQETKNIKGYIEYDLVKGSIARAKTGFIPQNGEIKTFVVTQGEFSPPKKPIQLWVGCSGEN